MQLLYNFLSIYEVILIVRILFSWIRPNRSHPVIDWIYKLTDPVLEPVRKLIPMTGMGIDFSPIVVFLVVGLIKGFLRNSMY
jgi:YggT family protein